MVAAIAEVTIRPKPTVAMCAVINYANSAVLFFFSVCTFGVQVLDKV